MVYSALACFSKSFSLRISFLLNCCNSTIALIPSSYLIVLPIYRRQGIGAALLKRSEEVFQQNGKYIFRVTALKASKVGLALLEKNNYCPIRFASSGSVIFEKKFE